MISIKYPIWKSRSVGIAEHKLSFGDNEVQILYRQKKGASFGEKIYPHTYLVSGKDAARYPVQVVRGVRLRIIPIADMRIKERHV